MLYWTITSIGRGGGPLVNLSNVNKLSDSQCSFWTQCNSTELPKESKHLIFNSWVWEKNIVYWSKHSLNIGQDVFNMHEFKCSFPNIMIIWIWLSLSCVPWFPGTLYPFVSIQTNPNYSFRALYVLLEF